MMEIKNKSFYNHAARKFMTETPNSWRPASPYAVLLWPCFAIRSIYRAGYWVRHTHYESWEVVSLEEGEMEVTHNEKKCIVGAGRTVLVPPGARKFSVGCSSVAVKRTIGVEGLLLGLLLKNLALDEFMILEDFVTPEFDALYEKIFVLLRGRNIESIPELSLLAYSLLIYASRRCEKTALPEELLKCQAFITQNLFQKILLEDLCAEIGCSKTTLNRLFRKYFKSSPAEYLIAIRINYAKKLLSGEFLPIKEVAARCGYRNQLFFSNDFRNRTGMTPSMFRKISVFR